MLLPLVWIWGLYRIQKIRIGLAIQFVLIAVFWIAMQYTQTQDPYLALGISGMTIPLWWVLNKRWVEDYNRKIAFK